MTNEQTNRLLTGGLSIEGLMAFRRAKYGKPTQTKEQFKEKFMDCQHCRLDGHCRKGFGYTQPYADDAYVSQPYSTGYKACCKWDGETLEKIDDLLKDAIAKGEVNDGNVD